MSETVAHLDRLPARRLRALVVPREHGAWGMLLVPLFTGAAVGLNSGAALNPLLMFATAALLLFWLRTPVESWLGTTPIHAQSAEERRFVAAVVTGLAIISGVLLSAIFWRGRNGGLFLIGMAAGGAFAAQAVVKRFGRPMRMPAQMIGALGLTSCAPAAYYLVTGDIGGRAIGLWFASWLFAADQIHFVQLRIHGARIANFAGRIRHGYVFLFAQIGMIASVLLLGRYGLFPTLLWIAFVPVLLRGFLWFVEKSKPLAVRRLGWTELAHAITFGVLLTMIFRPT